MDTHERLDFDPIGNGLEQNQAARGGDEGAACFAAGKPAV